MTPYLHYPTRTTAFRKVTTFYVCISRWRSNFCFCGLMYELDDISPTYPFQPRRTLRVTKIPSPKTELPSKMWRTLCTRGAFPPFSANPTWRRVRPSCKGSVVKGRVVYLHAGWFVVSGCHGDHWCLVHGGLCPQWAETVNIAATTYTSAGSPVSAACWSYLSAVVSNE